MTALLLAIPQNAAINLAFDFQILKDRWKL